MNTWGDGAYEDAPLPLELRETVIREWNEGNNSLLNFLNLFQNRLMRLWMEDAALMCTELGKIVKEGDIDEFRGEWVEMSGCVHMRLGCTNSRIGIDAILGNTIFECRTSMVRLISERESI